jgi:DNA polymerase-3 subunit alpha
MLVQYLQDVLPAFAKKLIIHLNIADLRTEMITKLSEIFQLNKGEHQVAFEVMELEKSNARLLSRPWF